MEKRFHLPDQENHFISSHALNKLLKRADGNASLAYLYILQQHGALDVQDAMEALRFSEQEVFEAVRVLVSLGLVSGKDAKGLGEQPREMPEREELPQYPAADIQREMTADASFAALAKAVEGILGRILTGPDLNTLMGIYRHLGLPPEVTYQLVCHLTKEHRARYGEGKSPTLRGIEKIAYCWARDDITTLDRAMTHIAGRERAQSEIGRLKKVLDLKQDKLTPTQEKYLYRWLDMGLAPEVIAKAYDKTVVSTGSLKWPYLDAILCDWHRKGLHTLDAVEAAEGGGSPGKKPPAKLPQPNVPTQQEIERKRRLLDGMK
ncbi:MAG: DnaD domain protein [Oscillospiraceae bacterium]|nr:DnaD domain protein [Oscillospiraceae bacterium]